MIEDKQWNRLLRGHTPGICTTCKKPLEYVGSGGYQCPVCGAVILDDFGKIKEYLSVNGPTPAWKLARELGIRRDVIEQYIKDGSVAMIQNEFKDKRGGRLSVIPMEKRVRGFGGNDAGTCNIRCLCTDCCRA